jgi:hydrogenase maturation protein HypF
MTATAGPVACRRAQVRVEGTVQGVGFRPYAYRLATELGLGGWVLNDAHGVLVEVEGTPHAIDEFVARLPVAAPPLAAIERIVAEPRTPLGTVTFEIRQSPSGEAADAPVTSDSATCSDCLRELWDPGDRRHRYPFINCTNCGPRFTIVRGIPYDRTSTTMAGFEMCPDCRREYDDPRDRRFHAQPNACPVCGPSVVLLDPGCGRVSWHPDASDPVRAAADALLAGKIVALKGIGGYHLTCNSRDEHAVATLRSRKHREDKPFALMAGDLDAASALVSLSPAARALLQSPQRPIVLTPRRPDAPVASSVAPGAPELGVMLPYSPLHHLLVRDCGTTLVMTSGNVSDEPICFDDDDAFDRLGAIADLFLVHDRPIETRTDDSVIRVLPTGDGGRGLFLRRSRGYVPGAVALPEPGARRPLLACGAELKNTFCVAKGTRAWVSHHVGDLTNVETALSFTDGIAHFERLFAVAPEVIAHDLHPEYLSTKYAMDRDGVELVGVQHHHAHLAACLAEHGESGPAIGAIYDGTGYGLDGTVWGGELLYGDLSEFRRVGALRAVPLPGGERAIRQPWRMACAWLLAGADSGSVTGSGSRSAVAGRGVPAVPGALAGRIDPASWERVAHLAVSGLASPQTTSAGRLFDAVAALCGVRPEINYEGQAAIELEAACDPHERGRYPMAVRVGSDGVVAIDPVPTISAVLDDVAGGVGTGVISARFHAALADATVRSCVLVAGQLGTEVVVLSGGVFANRVLQQPVSDGLAAAGLRVLMPRLLPPGDGGISYGQAVVAAARSAA